MLSTAKRVIGRIWTHPSNRGGRVAALGRAFAWQTWKRVTRTPVRVRYTDGFDVICHPDSGSASNVFYFNQDFDPEEMALVRRILRPGDGFVDGGANIGIYAMLAASLVGPTGRVVAFEPFPRHGDRLRENAAVNGFGQVRLVAAALTREPGTVSFVTNRDVSNRIQTRTDADADTITVRATTLDAELAEERNFTVGKLDLEGSEIAAFGGAQRMLAKGSPALWILEWNEGLFRKRGHDPMELVAVLAEHGYHPVRLEGDRLVRAEVPRETGNLFAAHADQIPFLEERLRGRPEVAKVRWTLPRPVRP
jgi:FkbM family methyltransferase